MKDALTAQHGVLRRRVDFVPLHAIYAAVLAVARRTDKQMWPVTASVYSTYRSLSLEDGTAGTA